MARQCIAAIAALSLSFASATPALGQEHRFAGFDGPRGANATITLRVPLGASSQRSRPTLALTVGAGRTLGAGTDGEPIVRQIRFADFRISEAGLENARVASFDLANLDRDTRLAIVGNKKNTILLFLMVLGGLTALAFLVNGHDRRSEPDEDTSTPTTPMTPTGG